MKKLLIGVAVLSAALLAGCNEADVASENVSTAADNFRILRRIVFINGITDRQELVIEGFCSLGNNDKDDKLSVTCKTSPTEYKKHFLIKSDNVFAVVEQIDAANVSGRRYKVMYQPTQIIPDIDIR